MTGRPFIRAAILSAVLLPIVLAIAPDTVLAQAARVGPGPAAPSDWTTILIASFIGGGAAALIGQLLGLWRDWVARTYRARPESEIECEFFRPQGQHRPVELRFIVANRGGARNYISKLTYWVRGIEEGAPLASFKGNRLGFPEEFVRDDIRPLPGTRLFVDPGTTQAFARSVMIPASLSLILVRVTIFSGRNRQYADERIFQIPANAF